jgi:hypothetical protein
LIGNLLDNLKKKSRSSLRKLWPTGADIVLNLKALKKRDKSQFGEQDLLLKFLAENSSSNWPKLYLELGAAYPIFHSNSYALSELSFKGISYDADERYSIQWLLLRRKDKFKRTAIVTSNYEHSIILHRFPSSHSSLSTTSSEQNTKWEAKFKKASKPIIVPARGIEEIYFEFKKIYDNFPTILLSDLEGVDKEIILKLLNSIEIENYPKCILLETEEVLLTEDNVITEFYKLYGKAGLSLFMVLK